MDKNNVIPSLLEAPILEHNEILKNAEDLLKMVRKLLNNLDEIQSSEFDFKRQYKLELISIANGDEWRMRICLKPLVWYDFLKKNFSEEASEIAINYIHKSNKANKDYWKENKDLKPPEIQKNKNSICKYKSCKPKNGQTCNFLHVEFCCEVEIQDKMETTHKCNFKTYKENTLQELLPNDTNYQLYLRPFEYTRELLLIPTPSSIQKGITYHTNSETINSEAFWMTIININNHFKSITKNNDIDKAISRVVVNFGLWETAVSLNPFFENCHTHAHLWLTPKFTRFLSEYKQIKDKRKREMISYMKYEPEDYIYLDAKELQLDVNSDMIKDLNNNFKSMEVGLNNKLNKMEESIAEILMFITKKT